ncbi:MAG TPA: HEAT repeat domain-containing protein [Planctomycetota bacterium]|nr:HEAT repeat domain-containing protein [Planctomycetota bacterium]
MTPGAGPRLASLPLLAALLAAAFPAAVRAQETRPATAAETRAAPTPESAAEALLGDRIATRRQASEWIAARLDVAGPALAKALLAPPVARFSFDGVRATGAVRHREVSEALLALLRKPDFRWKPQALEALADHAYARAEPEFVAAANASVWRMRAAAARGLAALKATRHETLVRALCDDEEAPVRLEAAKALWTLGHVDGLPYVVRDLSLDRKFFDVDVGAQARDAAAAFLNEACGGTLFAAGSPPLDLAGLRAALDQVKTALGARAATFPLLVPPHDPDATGLRCGYEVRSCVEGDFYVRFDAEGAVMFGRDRLYPATAAPELLLRMKTALEALDYGPRKKRFLGNIACDFERVGAFVDGGWRILVFGDGKRPPELAAFEADVLELIRATQGPAAADVHRRRIRPFGELP